MESWRPSVIDSVDHAITAINDIVVLLERDTPLSADILHLNYPQSAVDEFDQASQRVEAHLNTAKDITSRSFADTGNRRSRNAADINGLETSIREASSELCEVDSNKNATEARIVLLETAERNSEGSLSNAQRALSNARDELARHERRLALVHIGAMATFIFAPFISFAAAAVNLAVTPQAINEQENTVRRLEQELSSSRSHLQSQRDTLSHEQSERNRLSSRIAELNSRKDSLSNEVRRLQSESTQLADLSVRINDCLHTVGAALSSSRTIAAMHSMRNVVAGIRGVIAALGADATFEGPLALLDDAALDILDRRVAAIRSRSLAL